MTNQQYISIAKLLEQFNPELFEQYKLQVSMEIDIELLFIQFCKAINCFPVNIVGKPYNREASKNKALFVGVLITELKTEKLPRGMKKQLSTTLGMPHQKIGSFAQNVTLFLSIYCDFKNEVNEICEKIQRHEFNTNGNK
jgi:hypothetical protein